MVEVVRKVVGYGRFKVDFEGLGEVFVEECF